MAYSFECSFTDFLTVQRVAPSTKESYLRAVNGLSLFHNKQKPAELTNDQIQEYLRHSIQKKKLAWSSCNVLFCGLKKYYQEFLGRSINDFYIPPRKRSKKIPMLLSREEVARLLQAPANSKHRALLALIYSSGLRVSEAVRLKARHIESDRMMIRVKDGKGGKDRYTVLSKDCLELLRKHWRINQPEKWLFFGREKKLPLALGACPRIGILVKVEEFSENKHSHMVDIVSIIF